MMQKRRFTGWTTLVTMLAATPLTLAACGQPPPPAPPPAAPAAAAPAAQPAQLAPPPASPKPSLSPEQRVQRYNDCWVAFNARDLARLGDCYAPNAVAERIDTGMPPAPGNQVVARFVQPFITAFPDVKAEPQLVLALGTTVASITLFRGTHTGPLQTPDGAVAPTKRNIGMVVGHVVEFDGDRAKAERMYMDMQTLLGQLRVLPGPSRRLIEVSADQQVVVASESAAEKANLELFRRAAAAHNAHDAAALKALLADEVVVVHPYSLRDLIGPKKVMEVYQEVWKGFSDGKVEHEAMAAAGDFVLALGRFTGTNDGYLPSSGVWKETGKPVKLATMDVAMFQDGKLARHWIFANGIAVAEQLGLKKKK